jgi:hypothetical protein
MLNLLVEAERFAVSGYTHPEFPENYNDAGSRTGVPCLGEVDL